MKYFIAWDSTALVAATAKTIIELPTPANTAIGIEELVIGCDASTAGNLRIQMGTFTTTGTGTAATPQVYRGKIGIASAITAAEISSTVEPTGFTQGTAGGAFYPGLFIPLPMYYVFQWPLDGQFEVDESVNFAIRLTSSVAANTAGWVAWGE